MAAETTVWNFTAQRGYFSHDDDPESWEFRARTRKSLGLLERSYSINGSVQATDGNSQWIRFEQHISQLNQEAPDTKRYKLLYIVRHGQGLHNVKETEVGREEWNRHWAKLSGDGTTTWLDAELTPLGEEQATSIASIWSADGIRAPQSIYTSPLRRCLRTTALAFAPFVKATPGTIPIIKEKLRERLGVHTCDQRSTRSWIAKAYPSFSIEDGFTEDDELWQPDRRETLDEHVSRKTELLEDIFENDASDFIALTAHSGALMALFGATGWKKIPVAAGAVYPLLICGTRLPTENS